MKSAAAGGESSELEVAAPAEKSVEPEVKAEVAAQAPAPVAAPAATSSEIIDIAVPDIGEDGEVDVIDVLVAVGDVIEAEDGLITLETDKATMDVPSSHAGTVKEVFISTGDKVKQGSIVIKLETSSGAPVVAEAPVAAPEKAEAAVPAPAAKKAAPVPHHPQVGLTLSLIHI